MARIAGVNIPTNKRVIIALQYIHGIGDKFAEDIFPSTIWVRCTVASLSHMSHFIAMAIIITQEL